MIKDKLIELGGPDWPDAYYRFGKLTTMIEALDCNQCGHQSIGLTAEHKFCKHPVSPIDRDCVLPTDFFCAYWATLWKWERIQLVLEFQKSH